MSIIEQARAIRARMDADREVAAAVESAGGIRVDIKQSDKLGFDWEDYFVNDVLVKRTYIPQENPKGTSDNPIPWAPSVVLATNAFYTHNDVRKVWTGDTGVTATWDDSGWEVF